jgi:hypothetical protein
VEFCQDVASGKFVNPGLRTALDLLASGQADALVAAKMDRVARSAKHANDIIELSQEQGWALVVLDMGLDMTTRAGRAMAQMLAVFAEFERGLTSDRTKAASPLARHAVCRSAGHASPRPRSSGASSRRDAGESFGSIARALSAAAVLSPTGQRTWHESTVRRIYASATTAQRAAS